MYFNHTSERLVKDESGRVTAVIASDADGTYKKFVATKGVIVATVSYCQDPDMQAHYSPSWRTTPTATRWPYFNTGDGSGIKQALWVGAAMQANGDQSAHDVLGRHQLHQERDGEQFGQTGSSTRTRVSPT